MTAVIDTWSLIITACIGLVGMLAIRGRLARQARQKEMEMLNVVPVTQRPGRGEACRWEMGEAEQGMYRGDCKNGHARIFFEIKLAGKGPRITPQALTKALALAQRKYPPLTCHVRKLKCGVHIFERDPSNITVNVKWLDNNEYSAHALFERRIAEKWKDPDEDKNDKTHLAIVWVFCSNGGEFQHIVFELLHSVFDGSNLGCFVHDVLTWTLEVVPSPEEIECRPFPRCMESYLHDTNPNRIFCMVRGVANAISKLHIHAFRMIKKVQPHEYATSYRTTSIFHESLTKAQTQQFLASCRSHQVTITSAVLSAYLHAIAIYCDNGKGESFRTCALVAADARNVMKGDVPMDLASMCISALFHTSAKRTWTMQTESMWEVARDVRAQLLHQTQSGLLVCAGYMTGIGMSKPLEKSIGTTLFLSSWGAKNPIKETYGTGTEVVEASIRHPYPYGSHPGLSCYTVAGKLYFTLMAPTPLFDEVVLSKISAHAAELVKKLMADAA